MADPTIMDWGKTTVKAKRFIGPIRSSNITALALLGGPLTGTTDNSINNTTKLSTSGGNTYSDAAVNTSLLSVDEQLKELQLKVNQIINALKA